jgi:hypothetical protein
VHLRPVRQREHADQGEQGQRHRPCRCPGQAGDHAGDAAEDQPEDDDEYGHEQDRPAVVEQADGRHARADRDAGDGQIQISGTQRQRHRDSLQPGRGEPGDGHAPEAVGPVRQHQHEQRDADDDQHRFPDQVGEQRDAVGWCGGRHRGRRGQHGGPPWMIVLDRMLDRPAHRGMSCCLTVIV